MKIPEEYNEISRKHAEALRISREKLIKETIENNSYLVVSENGKIVKLYADDLKRMANDELCLPAGGRNAQSTL